MYISFTKGSRVKVIADCPFKDALGIVIYSNQTEHEAVVMLDHVVEGERSIPVEYEEIELVVAS
jgi:transcription antitermination factor NusG